MFYHPELDGDLKYATALVENRIPVEGPAYTELLQQRVQRLRELRAALVATERDEDAQDETACENCEIAPAVGYTRDDVPLCQSCGAELVRAQSGPFGKLKGSDD